jgi:nitrogenase molybdenum-iron protein NifN
MFREKTENHSITAESGPDYAAVRNACKLCAPLGACMVFKGIRGCLPMLHGSQGCATYIRRYMISHFKEPVDIASSNFSEESTIFGGARNFSQGIDNVIRQYDPEVIGIASTCLSETIGEDIPGLIRTYQTKDPGRALPHFVTVSTPSYRGTHMNGFQDTVLAVIRSLAYASRKGEHINFFPGFLSPADLRSFKEILQGFDIKYIMLPDYSETLDGTNWKEYQLIPEGGTRVDEIALSGSARASIELGAMIDTNLSAGSWLEENYSVNNYSIPLPVGISLTDRFMDILRQISGKPVPEYLVKQRGRLIDAYADGHKYTFGKKAVVYGEEDLVVSMVTFLSEIGIDTVLAASGAESGKLKETIEHVTGKPSGDMIVANSMDFEQISRLAEDLDPDIFIGNSKGYYISRRLKKPLIRIGFPVHDRFGGQRILHAGYEGTQQLFDRIANALIEYKQENSPVGYKYI